MARKPEVVLTFSGDARGLNSTVDQVKSKLLTFGGTADSLGGRLDRISDRFKSAGERMREVGRTATVGLTLPILAGFGYAQQAASNLNEAVNATNVVFGEASATIDRFAQDSARSMGLSERAFREAVVPMGAMLQNLGFSQQEAADKAVMLSQRAADMASVFNTDVSDALEAINAALRGEADPIERFGVSVNEAAVQAKALEMGLADTTAELTAHDKAQARLALIMEQTNDIAGDFAATSDETANKQRIAAAEAENMAAKFGQNLEPVMSKLLDVGSRLLEWFNNLSPGIQEIILYGGLFLAVLGPLVSVVGTLSTVIGFLISPLGLVVLAIAAVIAIGYLLITHWETIKETATKVWDWVWSKIEGVYNWIKENWPTLLGILTGPIGWAVLLITNHWDTIKKGFSKVKDWIGDRIDDIVGFFKGLPGRLRDVASGVWDFLKDAFKRVINGIIDIWNSLDFSFTLGPWEIGGFDPPGPGSFPGFTIGPYSFNFGLPDLPKFHDGGVVPGAPGTEVVATLQAGETVLPIGLDLADAGPTVNIYVSGSVVAERDLVRMIRDELVRGGL